MIYYIAVELHFDEVIIIGAFTVYDLVDFGYLQEMVIQHVVQLLLNVVKQFSTKASSPSTENYYIIGEQLVVVDIDIVQSIKSQLFVIDR